MFENIALLNTAIFSENIGDYIIVDSLKKEMNFYLQNKHILEIPTHSPISLIYQNKHIRNILNDYSISIVCGTNLLNHNLFRRVPRWNINIFNSTVLNNVILVGVGTDESNLPVNRYTKKLYSNMLSKEYIHSTRDTRTCKFLNALGFKAINTGCPTMWSLTNSYCKDIPREKSQTVVFTITDYCKESSSDKKMINYLINNYRDIYFWPQGAYDYKYYSDILYSKKIKVINPNLNSYDMFLKENNCDYVGTRLHAGIRALQYKHRAIIISVDSRTKDIQETYSLNIIERDHIDKLDAYINSPLNNDPCIDVDSINKFLSQF